METYKDLKDNWKKTESNLPETEDVIEEIQKKIGQLRKGQKMTNVILAISTMIVIAYLIYVFQFGRTALNVGLLVMITTLVIRLFIEIRDRRKLRNLNPLLTRGEFKGSLQAFYKWRGVLHKVITPILFVCYIYGFTLLLPTFKAIFSKGFYTYLLVSGFGSLLIIAIIIIRQARRELEELKSLE